MAMDQKRQGEIALKLVKYTLRQQGVEISKNKFRELGRVSKETGIPLDELKEFAEPLLHEFLKECFTLTTGNQGGGH